MEKRIQFRSGFIEGKSFFSRDVGELANGHFDVALFSSSWDGRCIEITKAINFESDLTILILPERKDEQGLREKHDAMLREFTGKVGKDIQTIEDDTVNVRSVWSKIEALVLRHLAKKDRPLRMLIDTTTCVRYWSLGLLAMGFRLGFVDEAKLFYCEARYRENREEAIVFTRGRWETIHIPFLEGSYSPEKRRAMVVSMGFEGVKTLRAVNQYEPDRVSALLPIPGFMPRYDSTMRKENRLLLESYSVPPRAIIRAFAGDAILAWEQLTQKNLESSSENIYYLLCGTKPHSIGMALRALSVGTPIVLYFLPEEHEISGTEANGNYWLFETRDLTVFPD